MGTSPSPRNLVASGLICRTPDESDGRSLSAGLTEAGRHLTEAAFRADMASETQYLAALDARELETLSALLRKLNQSIEARLAPPNP